MNTYRKACLMVMILALVGGRVAAQPEQEPPLQAEGEPARQSTAHRASQDRAAQDPATQDRATQGRATQRPAAQLPFEILLDGEKVQLDVRQATLEVVRDATAEAFLRVTAPTSDEASDEPIDLRQGSGFVRLVRRGADPEATGGEGAIASRWLIELVMGPEQPLEIVGADLEILIEGVPQETLDEDVGVEEDEDFDEAFDERRIARVKALERGDPEELEKLQKGLLGRAACGVHDSGELPSVELRVDQSNINLFAVEGVRIDASDSFVRAEQTSDLLYATLVGGSVEAIGHEGPVDLSAQEAEIWLEDARGKVVFEIEGGALSVSGGSGHREGKIRDGFGRFEGGRGAAIVAATDANLEVATVTQANVQLSGSGLEVALEEVQGRIETNMLGGRLTGRDLSGQVKVTARGDTEVELETLNGPLNLSLESGSGARVTGLAGAIQGSVHDGRLEVDGVRHVQLRGQRSELRLAGIERIRQIDVTDSILDLDLSGMRHDPLLTLRGASEASVRMQAPCGVKLDASSQAQFAQVSVSGCMMHSQSQGRVMFQQRGIEGNRQMMLRLAVSADSTVDVEGVF
ncbi:MAG: hypothetical protein AAF560_06040 [Acidobacteriota bacterium]